MQLVMHKIQQTRRRQLEQENTALRTRVDALEQRIKNLEEILYK